MKIIFSSLEFGKLSDLSNNVSNEIVSIDSECEIAPPLIDMFKDLESSIININVLPDLSVEIEYNETYCLDTFKIVEKHYLRALPILFKISPIVEQIVECVSTVVEMFNKSFIDELKAFGTSIKDDFEELINSYME